MLFMRKMGEGLIAMDCFDNFYASINWDFVRTFIVITTSGLIGGGAAYHLDKLDETTKAHHRVLRVRGYLIVGVAAAFAVPLFLHTASSNLIKESRSEFSLYFVLSGFCVLAAIFSRRFLRSIGYHALKIAEKADREQGDTRRLLTQVAEEYKQTNKDVERNRRIMPSISLIESGKFNDAESALQLAIAEDTDDAEAYAWLAYALKRKSPPDLLGAIVAMERALEIGKDDKPFNWVYNLACYKAMSGAQELEVVRLLREAYGLASEVEKSKFSGDLTNDQDFDRLRATNASSAFSDFLNELTITKDAKNGS